MADLALKKILEIRQRDFPGLDKKLLEEVYALLKLHAHDVEPKRTKREIHGLIVSHVNETVSGGGV